MQGSETFPFLLHSHTFRFDSTYKIQQLMINYTHTPMSLYSGISELGGILFVFKLLLVSLYFLNRQWFKVKLTNFMKDSAADYITAPTIQTAGNKNGIVLIQHDSVIAVKDQDDRVGENQQSCHDEDVQDRYSIETFEKIIR